MSPPRRRSLGLHAYGPVLRTRGARQIIVVTLLSRTGQFGIGLAVLLAVEQATGSFGIAGTASGAFAAGLALGRALQGRLADRHGATRMLLPVAALFCVAVAALAAVTSGRAGAAPALALSALLGFALPGLDAVTRMLWGVLAPDPEPRLRAYSLDAVTVEVAAMLGPSIAGVLATTISPAVALATTAAMIAGATVTVALSRLARSLVPHPDAGQGALARPLVLPVVLMFGIGLMAGALEVAIPAFAALYDSPTSTGPLFACWAAGSLVGGLWYGSRSWRVRAEVRLLAALAGLTAGCAVLALASSPIALGALLLLTGVPTGPTITTVYLLLDERVPRQRLVEAFSWLTSSIPMGVALGAVLGGWTVAGLDAHAALGLAAILSLVALGAGAAIARAAPSGVRADKPQDDPG